MTEALKRLLPLVISECSHADDASGQRGLFDALLHQHHYLSYRSSVGENRQYLIQAILDAASLMCLMRASHFFP